MNLVVPSPCETEPYNNIGYCANLQEKITKVFSNQAKLRAVIGSSSGPFSHTGVQDHVIILHPLVNCAEVTYKYFNFKRHKQPLFMLIQLNNLMKLC